MIDVDQLLTPLSDDAPCGEDLSYDPALGELDTLMQGKPETQFSAAEEPNWRDIQKSCLALFERTKDLRVSIDLAVPLLKLDGLPALPRACGSCTACSTNTGSRFTRASTPRTTTTRSSA